MKIQVSDWTETQKRVVVEIPAEKVQPEIDRRYRSVAKKAHIKGFRPGRAPVSLIKSLYGGVIQEEVAQKFIDETFSEVLESQQLKPIAQSDLEEFHYTEDGDLVYTVVVYVTPEFEVSGYKGMELRAPKQQKSVDEMIEEEINRIRRENAEYISIDESLSDGLIALCDIRRIDKSQEEKVEGDDLNDTEFEIGSGEFNPDIERQMIGMKPGEKWILELSFGENAPSRRWENQSVRLEIHLKDVLKRKLPEPNDELARLLGYSSFEDLREELKSNIEKRLESEKKYFLERQIRSKLLEMHNFQVPEKAVQQSIEEKISNIKLQFSRQGIRLPDHIFKSSESKERLRPEAEIEIKYEIILDRIAAREGITLSPEEEKEIIESVVKTIGEGDEAIREKIVKHPYFERLKRYRLHEKVGQWIVENAVIVEEEEESKNSSYESSEELRAGGSRES